MLLQIFIGLSMMLTIIIAIGMFADNIYAELYNWFMDEATNNNVAMSVLGCISAPIILAIIASIIIILFFGGLVLVLSSLGHMLTNA